MALPAPDDGATAPLRTTPLRTVNRPAERSARTAAPRPEAGARTASVPGTVTVPGSARPRGSSVSGRPAGADPPPRRAVVAGGVALLCLTAVLLESAADLLPDDPVVWVLTPLRLAVLLGLVAVAVAGPPRLRTPLDLPVVALLAAAALATVLNGQPWAPWRAVLTSVGVFVLAVGVRRVLPDARPALALLALVAVAVAGTAAARQSANGTDTGFCRGAFDGSADLCSGVEMIRATGTFANPNLLAAFLVLLLPLAAAGSAGLADRASRLVGTAVVVVGYAAVLLTASRGGILAAVAGAAAFVVLRRPTRRRLLLAAGAAIGAAGVLAWVSGGRFGVRSDVWGAALALVVDRPWGVGPGRAGALLDAAIPGDEAFAHAHDLWLNWAVEAGLPGLAAVLAITGVAAAVTLRAARRGSAGAAAAGAGLAGFAVLSLADHPANAVRIATALAVVLAAVAAEPRRTAAAVRSRSGSR